MKQLRDVVSLDATIYDAIATFQLSLAQEVEELDFFGSATYNPAKWVLDTLVYDEDNGELIMSALYNSSIDVIPSFLSMRDITVEVRISVDEGNISDTNSTVSLSLAGFVVSGSGTVEDIDFDLSVTKENDTLLIEGSPQPPNSTIRVAFLTERLASLLPTDTILDDVSLRQARLRALYSNSSGYALSLSGFPTIAGWESFETELILQRPSGSATDVFIMTVQFSSFRLASLVSQLSGIDMFHIPLIGTLTIQDSKLTIASDQPSDLLLDNADDVQVGTTVEATFSSGGNQVAYLIHLNEGNVTFETRADSNNRVTIGELFDALVPNFDSSSVVLPPGVPNVFNIAFKDFYYDSQSTSIGVTVELGDDVELVPGFVTVSDTYLTIIATTTSPSKVSVSGGAKWTIGNHHFTVTVESVDGGNGYIVRGESDTLRVGEILTEFGAAFLPGELRTVLSDSGLDSFRIDVPRVKIPFGTASNDFELFLSGRPVIGDWSGVTLNAAVVNRNNAGTTMAVGFEFVGTNFAGLIKSLTGVSVDFISLLDQSLQTAVVISPTTMTDVALTGSLLGQLQVTRGVSVIAAFSFPADCKSDLLCQFAKSTLGADASLQLKSTITSTTDFVIAAAVSGISLGQGLTLSEAALEFQFGTETSVGISGTLHFNDPDLNFIGAIRKQADQGLTLSMRMVGIWENAFDIDWLSFGNAVIGMSITPGAPLTGLELGAEVRIGTARGKELVGQAYVGYDRRRISPNNNYYYTHLHSVDIQDILDAFGMSVSIPRPLALARFPNGLTSSYANKEQEPVPGVVIPTGAKLNGTIDIFGFRLMADIELNPPTDITIDIHMHPLRLANGLFKLYRSSSETNKGPRFYAKIRSLSVTVKAEGYAIIMNTIKQRASLEIIDNKYVTTVTSAFFGYEATLKVYANNGPLNSAAFKVSGSLSSAWRKAIVHKVIHLVQENAGVANRVVNGARSAVRNAWTTFNDAVNAEKIAKRAFDAACSLVSCSKEKCFSCPKPKCCKKVWGACVLPCPTIGRCCVPNPLYLGCKVAYAACSAARDRLLGALNHAGRLVRSARTGINQAQSTLSSQLNKYKAGLDVFSFISRQGLGRVIYIQKIEFDVDIGVANRGFFNGKITASFLGRYRETFTFYLRLPSVSLMAKYLAEKAIPGITKFI